MSGAGVCLSRGSGGSHGCSIDLVRAAVGHDVLVVRWYYDECPPEDECENGHHSCNSETESCVDELRG